MAYKLQRAADRLAMLGILRDAVAKVPGVEVTTGVGLLDPREVFVRIEANGFAARVEIDGDSTWGVMGHWFPAAYPVTRLFTGAFQSRLSIALAGRPHHKASGPFAGQGRQPIDVVEWEVFCAKFTNAARSLADGSALQEEAKVHA